MSEQGPKPRPTVVVRRRAGDRPATVRDALDTINQVGRQQNARLLASIGPVQDYIQASTRELHAAVAGATAGMLGTIPAAESPAAPAIADPPAPDLAGHEWAQIQAIWEAAESQNTRRAYQSQWRRFTRYCASRGEPALPAHPATVANYLTTRAEQGIRMPTLRQAAAAIAHVHVHQEQENPCANAGVKRLLKGLARERGSPAGQARGLTEKDLAAIRASARFPRRWAKGRLEKEAVAMRRGDEDIALCALMRDGLLRRSEAAAARWGDLTWVENGNGVLLLGRSKTDQEGRGHTAFVGAETMADLERIRPPGYGPEERIFGISASQIGRRIAAAARAAGLGDGYSGHSPRVGMAQDLVADGRSLAELQQAGRWKSAVMPAYYARNQLSELGAVAKFHAARAERAVAADGLVRPDFGAGRPPADVPDFRP